MGESSAAMNNKQAASMHTEKTANEKFLCVVNETKKLKMHCKISQYVCLIKSLFDAFYCILFTIRDINTNIRTAKVSSKHFTYYYSLLFALLSANVCKIFWCLLAPIDNASVADVADCLMWMIRWFGIYLTGHSILKIL